MYKQRLKYCFYKLRHKLFGVPIPLDYLTASDLLPKNFDLSHMLNAKIILTTGTKHRYKIKR